MRTRNAGRSPRGQVGPLVREIQVVAEAEQLVHEPRLTVGEIPVAVANNRDAPPRRAERHA
jgi:hypothetical protein